MAKPICELIYNGPESISLKMQGADDNTMILQRSCVDTRAPCDPPPSAPTACASMVSR
jgi:hypothetical protein